MSIIPCVAMYAFWFIYPCEKVMWA